MTLALWALVGVVVIGMFGERAERGSGVGDVLGADARGQFGIDAVDRGARRL